MRHEKTLKPEGLRFAHSDGFTDLCFSKEDGRLLSAGDDGYACIWSDNAAEDSQMMHQLGDSISCCSIQENSLSAVIAGTTLSEFDYPSCSFKRICIKLSDHINHFVESNFLNTLAVGSSDFKVRVIDKESLAIPLTLSDHHAPILSVAYSGGNDEFLASSSCDSTVRLWSTKDGKCVSTFGRVLPKSNDISNSVTLARLQFSPDSKKLYVPTEGEIKVYDVRNWDKVCEKIELPKKTQVSSMIRFSPGGQHFAAVCKDVLAIYSLSQKQWIARMTHGRPLCVAVWQPNASNRLAFSDNRGQIGFTTAPITETVSSASVDDDEDAALLLAAEEFEEEISKTDVDTKKDNLEMDIDAALDDFSNSDSPKKSKNFESSKSSKKNPFLDLEASADEEEPPLTLEDEEPMDDDNDPVTDLGRIRNEFKEFFSDDDGEDDDDEDDENSKSGSKPQKKLPGKTSTPTGEERAPVISAPRPTVSYSSDSHLQEPFQNHSTPSTRGQTSRFLQWTQLGVVRLYQGESENQIEAEFHDAALHPPVSLSSTDDFNLAALSRDLLVLVTSQNYEDDDNSVCRLRVLTLSSWDATKEWTCEFPDGEYCVSVAIADRWFAAMTSKNMIRIYSHSGFQLALLSFNGSPVTCAASGDSLAVVYHSGIGAHGNQNLHFDLYKFSSKQPKLLLSGPLPITPRSTLTWLSFGSDHGLLFSSDSKSIVRVFSPGVRAWTPIADLRKCGQVKSRHDHYWPVGISEKQNQLFAIFCKANHFPAILPRPILSSVPMGVPLCDINSDGGKLEDEAIRLRVLCNPDDTSEADLKLQETLMRLFAMAVKQDRQCRAAEIADSMPSSHAIQLAGKYAARLRLGVLADHLNEMSLRRMAESDSYLPSVYETNDQFDSVSNYVPSTINSSSQVGQKEDPNLPVLATPPVVTLVKRPLAGLTPYSGGSSHRQETITESESVKEKEKESSAEIISEDEQELEEEVEDDVQEVEDESSRDSEPPVSASSRNPFSASKKNPFAKPSTTSKSSSKDAFSCFEKVDPPKVKSSTASTDSAKKKRQPRKSNTDNSEVKRKKTATKRKSDEDNGTTANNENEDTTESNDVEAQEPKTKKSAVTSKKLTDFMFTKN